MNVAVCPAVTVWFTGCVAIVGAPEEATTILRFAVALCIGELESVTLTTKEDVPGVVGVPLIWPELLSVSPAGKEPEEIDQVKGAVPPLAERVAE